MPFFDLLRPIYYLPTYLPTYLPIYLPINFFNNNFLNDFNLSIKLTQSNNPLFISQIVNHFASQNDKV
jgi:hypothetical protein